jgi:hypothetical protein
MHGPMIFARQAGKKCSPANIPSNVTHFKYQNIGSPYHEAGSATLAA